MNSILEIFQRRNKHTTGNTDIYPKPIIADFTKNAMNAEERALLVLDGILAGMSSDTHMRACLSLHACKIRIQQTL